MFKDEHKVSVWSKIRQHELPALQRLLTADMVAKAVKRVGISPGRGMLSVSALVWLAVGSAVHAGKTFSDILQVTVKLLSDQPGWSRSPLGRKQTARRSGKKRCKHDPHGSACTVSEEAFVQARQRLPIGFWAALFSVIAEHFVSDNPRRVRWQGHRLLMLDGTHIALPRHPALTKHYGTSTNGKRTQRPQARLTMLALAQTRMPLRYELSPWSTHEQTAARQLLTNLEVNDLVLMDRGFWSYALFWQVQRQSAYFAIRRRAAIPLKKVRKLGDKDSLVTWRPNFKSRRRGCQSRRRGCKSHRRGTSAVTLPREITLRLIEYKIRGFRPSAVVTNLLDARTVPRDAWTQLASKNEAGKVLEAGLYHRRWEIETLFRELKVEQKMEGSLRGRTPATIAYEVAGHVLLYTLTRWLMVKAATQHDCNPLHLSFKNAQRELDDLWPTLTLATPTYITTTLFPKLLQRIASHPIDIRPGRYFKRISDTYKTKRKRSKSSKT